MNSMLQVDIILRNGQQTGLTMYADDYEELLDLLEGDDVSFFTYIDIETRLEVSVRLADVVAVVQGEVE